MVGCTDFNCGGNVDFGHFDGVQNGIPSVHWVIQQWNKRTPNVKVRGVLPTTEIERNRE